MVGQPARKPGKLFYAAVAFCGLLAVFWTLARYFRLSALADHPVSTFISFALLFAPYWFLGFGVAPILRRVLPKPWRKIAVSALLVLPYLTLSLPRGEFHWQIAAALLAIAAGSAALLSLSAQPGTWHDLVVLSVVGLVIDLGTLTSGAWLGLPGQHLWPTGLGGFPKLMMMDLAVYLYLVVKPLDGIGYHLVPTLADLKIGLREVLFYAPIVITLGLALGFLHFHRELPELFRPPAAWTFTFFFVALPEELYFRGLIQNLLERRMSPRVALLLTSALFGLSHFNKGLRFNWRYVLLASIAGVFYGRAWKQQHRLVASSITHTTVDTVWSLWFR